MSSEVKKKSSKTKTQLSDKQKLFCDEYLKDFNATRAYMKAYNSMNEKSAGVEGYKNLRKPKVTEYIARRMKDRTKRTEIDQDYVVKKLKNIADANIKDIVEIDPENYSVIVKDINSIPDEVAYAINAIESTRDGIRVKFCSKEKCLELLGKHLGMYQDNLNIKGKLSIADFLDDE